MCGCVAELSNEVKIENDFATPREGELTDECHISSVTDAAHTITIS